jgi:hypothetical protein
MKKTIKKAQHGKTQPKNTTTESKKPVTDSTGYYQNKLAEYRLRASYTGRRGLSELRDRNIQLAEQAKKDIERQGKKGKPGYDKMGNPIKKQKTGGKTMLKRADGSYSQRGLWDNIRAAKGSGKKPTAAMLKQEKKIKAQSKKK